MARSILRRGLALGLAVLLTAGPLTLMSRAEAATTTEKLLLGAAAFAYINGQLNNLNEHHQADLLRQTKQKTGVYADADMNSYVAKVSQHLMGNGIIANSYAVYITPDKNFNAFCTLGRVIAVNRGTVELLDEDELAAVLGHEMGHGEHKDPVDGTKKLLGLALAVDLYLARNPNTTSEILTVAAANYVDNEVITMDEEWRADNAGFDNAVAAGYNPGGPAASMVKLRTQLGELWHEGLSRAINPNNHPKTSDRVNNFAKRLQDYSNGHVSVAGDQTVRIDGHDIVTPVKSGRYLAGERAYLVAGNLARLYHMNAMGRARVGDDGAVYVGEHAIMTPAAGDVSAQELADRLNAITRK